MSEARARRPTYDALAAEVERLRRVVADLERQVRKTRKVAEEAERAGKRQASPFSKGAPTKEPKKPGRKAGMGLWSRRAKPEVVDETLRATLPSGCSCCGGALVREKVVEQFQTELPRIRPIVKRFELEVGRCKGCGRRVQARHAEQTSDAIGAAASQIGPNAIAQAAMLNKSYGLSWGKIATFFERTFQLKVTRGALARAVVERLGSRAEPHYEELIQQVRGSAAVSADETSWKVGGKPNWLWIFTTPNTTVYEIAPSRGFDVIERTLGADFDGLLCRDGWSPYRLLDQARHQTCLAHFFKRIKDILETAERGAARFPKKLKRLLKNALKLRDERENYTPHGFAVVRGRLEAELWRLATWQPTYEPNRLLANHVRRERAALLTFLHHPEIDASNWRAEQGLRPAVVNRKVCGGNRSTVGARAQAVLASVIRTCAARGRDAIDFFVRLLRGEQLSLAMPQGP